MEKFKQKRKPWFNNFKKITKCKYKEPQFIFLGKKVSNGALILSNHEGTDSPMSLELYADFPIRFWGAHEMNSGLKKMYKYQSEVYYHQKKHWNLVGAKTFCLVASPLTNLFYKGLNLISTYPDGRFKNTLNESVSAIKEGDNIVIFPEDSSEGYLAEMKSFYAGFVLLADTLLKQGIDADIYPSYFNKASKIYLFDEPLKYSDLKKQSKNKQEIAQTLLERCNALGKADIDTLLQNKTRLLLKIFYTYPWGLCC